MERRGYVVPVEKLRT